MSNTDDEINRIKTNIQILRNLVTTNRDFPLIKKNIIGICAKLEFYTTSQYLEECSAYFENVIDGKPLVDILLEFYNSIIYSKPEAINFYMKELNSFLSKLENINNVSNNLRQSTNERPTVPEKSIFISHASENKSVINSFIDRILQNGMDINATSIFCSSANGTDIKSGTDWRKEIVKNIKRAKIILLFISPDFKRSEICQNELGACYIVDAEVLPIIFGNIDNNTCGILKDTRQNIKLVDSSGLDKIKDIIEKTLNIKTDTARWNEKKDLFLEELNSLTYE